MDSKPESDSGAETGGSPRPVISVVSPVYCAERYVEELVSAIQRQVDEITHDYEIVLVDDGSPDESWSRIEEACRRDSRVKGIRLSRNFGQNYALTAALQASRGDHVIVMDCDLQDDPAYIPDLYQAARDGDIVFTRKRRRAHRRMKNLLGQIFHRTFNLLVGSREMRSLSEVGNYSLLSRRVVDAFNEFHDYHRHYLATLRWLGFESTCIDIEHRERPGGGSSYTLGKMFREAIVGITAQTDRLLHVSVAVGFLFFLGAVGGVVYILAAYFLRGFQQGWASVIVVILSSTSAILLSLGILGIYLGKTFEQTKNRPLYVVRERLNIDADSAGIVTSARLTAPRDRAEERSQMSWQRHFDEVEEQGFVIVPGIATADEVFVLRAEVMETLSQDWQACKDLPGKQEFIVLDLLRYCPSVVRLLENEKMHAMFSHFLSDTCILYSTTSTILCPKQHHYTSEIHTDTPRLVPGYHLGMLMTLALDDFTEDNGATYYLPGSHRSMDRPSDEEFYDNAVRVVRQAGDAVFFNPSVWHAGGHNKTDKGRAGCTIYACRSWMRQRFDFPRMVDDRVLSLLGERGTAFLGFNVRVPTSMSDFYRLPEDRLYKPGQG